MAHALAFSLCLAPALCSVSLLPAQTLRVVRDINTTPKRPVVGSLPSTAKTSNLFPEDFKFARVGSSLLFAAQTYATGRELYSFDGSKVALVKDIRSGPSGSAPADFFAKGTNLWFVADDGVHGKEPWVSDGTPAGTKLFADAVPGSAGSNAELPVPFAGGRILFFGDSPKGRGLWISDGTTSGTKLLADLSAGSAQAVTLRDLRPDPAGTRAYFQLSVRVSTYYYGYLWTTDGTAAGTKSLVRVMTTSTTGFPGNFRFVGSKMLFTMRTYREGTELWITDGTVLGTKLLKDILPGSGSGTNLSSSARIGTKVLFEGNSFLQGRELWITDGTAAGTRLLKDLIPGRSSGYVFGIVPDPGGTKVWFASRSATSGYDLWSSDGTTAGTKVFAKSLPAKPRFLQASGGKLFFSLSEAGYGYEPWISDGTASGTHRIADLYPGVRSGYGWYTTEVSAGRVAFTTDSPLYGTEIGVSSGTAATTKIHDLATWTLGPVTESDEVDSITPFFGRILFFATDGGGAGKHGRELWISDGTAAGTRLVKDVNPGPASGAGGNLVRAGTKVFFSANDSTTGYELWVTDGTAAGTHLVKDLNPNGSSFPQRMAGIGDKVYFMAQVPGKGPEPCVSDGTAAGTFVLKDILPGAAGSYPDYFAGLPGRVLFAARSPGLVGTELWITDGTPAGTKLLKDINPGASSGDPAYMTLFRGKVFFQASHFKYGPELWVSDFTAAGTSMLKDLVPGTAGLFPVEIQDVGGKLFFLNAPSAQPRTLWSSDGTPAGTQPLITVPAHRGGCTYPTGVGSRRIYFTSSGHPTQGDDLSYFELSAKTIKDLDLVPGTAGAQPHNAVGRNGRFAVLGSRVFFSATKTPSPGADMQLSTVDNGATAQPVGDVAGNAQLWSADPVLGATAAVQGWSGKSLPIHVLLLGAPAEPPIPISGGFRSYVSLAGFVILGAGGGSTWSLPLPIPADPSLIGGRVMCQDWVLDGKLFPAGMALSNGVGLTLGY